MSTRIWIAVFASFFAISALSAQNPPTVKKTTATESSPTSGKDMYLHYCAVCHGKDGKGAGPAAAALKKTPADLTKLTARNNGKFPDTKVVGYIEGSDELASHGSRDMPIWGEVFRSLTPNSPATVTMRIANLSDYLKSIQAK